MKGLPLENDFGATRTPTPGAGPFDSSHNAPIVSSNGGKVDHASYLQNVGNADIFFATDFRWLASAYFFVNGTKSDATVVSSDVFLSQNVNPQRTQTRTGYNPMLEDYTNTGAIQMIDFTLKMNAFTLK